MANTMSNHPGEGQSSDVVLCGALHPQPVFSHYAYGDPLPVYARFVGEDEDEVAEGYSGARGVTKDKAIVIYVACEREKGHVGEDQALTPL